MGLYLQVHDKTLTEHKTVREALMLCPLVAIKLATVYFFKSQSVTRTAGHSRCILVESLY